MYAKQLVAGWGDMDFNAHMGATAYLSKCFDVRMMFFAENGYPMAEFARLRIGPVGMKDELEYFHEVGLLDDITVTFAVAGLSADGSRWRLRQEVLRGGKPCARLTSTGGWLDLAARKLTTPPEALLALFRKDLATEDFTELPSSLKP